MWERDRERPRGRHLGLVETGVSSALPWGFPYISKLG